jgi:uncharacterized protein (TIGR01777 family)
LQRILLTGASGLIGRALQNSFEAREVEVVRMVRGAAKEPSQLSWDSLTASSAAALSGFDTVIHLAGESVVGRWTPEKKKAIRDSRLNGTRNLAEALAKTEKKPRVFVCASAIGFYGDRGDEILREDSPAGQGFLPEVCLEWEKASGLAADVGIRTVNLRTGLVLSDRGGALEKMLAPFKLGLGGRIGSGQQWWSWIHMDDIVGGIHHALTTESLSGPMNMVSPNPVRNAEFTKVLADVLRRPAILPVPPFVLHLAFGRIAADEMFLSSARVAPEKLKASGYHFRYSELLPALENLV